MTNNTTRDGMTIGRIVLLIFHIQHAAAGWLFGAFVLLFRIAHTPRWEEGVLTATRRAGNRSITALRFIAFTASGRGSLRIKRHERTHRWQSEDLAFGGFFLGAIVTIPLWFVAPWWAPLVVWDSVWILSPVLFLALEYVTAVLRFGVPDGPESWIVRVYRVGAKQSQHERSAYAQTHDTVEGSSSWWERHGPD